MNKRLCRLKVRFLLITDLADLLIGDSALLLLYFGESRTRSRNSAIVPIFPEVVVIYVCLLLCKSKVFLSIKGMIVRIKQDDNYF